MLEVTFETLRVLLLQLYTNALIKKGSLLMQRGEQEHALEQFDKAVEVGSLTLILLKET